MASRICHRSTYRVAVIVTLALLLPTARTAFAQDAPPLSIQQTALARVSQIAAVPLDGRGIPRPTTFHNMYVAFALMQAVDVHSTIVTIGAGAREANPLMGRVAGNPAALIGVKAASATGTIFFIEKLRKKNRVAAAVTMAAIDTAYALVVMHNARVASQLNAR